MIPLSESAFEDWNEWIGEEEDMDGLRSTVFKNVKAQFFFGFMTVTATTPKKTSSSDVVATLKP